MNFRVKCVLAFVILVVFALMCIQPSVAVARDDFKQIQWYVGGGVSHNSLDNADDVVGAQVFLGLDLPYNLHSPISTHLEVGYMFTNDFDYDDLSGSFDHTGVWTAGLLKLHFNNEFRALARLGYDFGDDDGILFGAGGEISMNRVSRDLFLRGEFVARDDIDSFQINLVQYL